MADPQASVSQSQASVEADIKKGLSESQVNDGFDNMFMHLTLEDIAEYKRLVKKNAALTGNAAEKDKFNRLNNTFSCLLQWLDRLINDELAKADGESSDFQALLIKDKFKAVYKKQLIDVFDQTIAMPDDVADYFFEAIDKESANALAAFGSLLELEEWPDSIQSMPNLIRNINILNGDFFQHEIVKNALYKESKTLTALEILLDASTVRWAKAKNAYLKGLTLLNNDYIQYTPVLSFEATIDECLNTSYANVHEDSFSRSLQSQCDVSFQSTGSALGVDEHEQALIEIANLEKRVTHLPALLLPKTRTEKAANKELIRYLLGHDSRFILGIHDACYIIQPAKKQAVFNAMLSNTKLFNQFLNLNQTSDNMLVNSLLHEAIVNIANASTVKAGKPAAASIFPSTEMDRLKARTSAVLCIKNQIKELRNFSSQLLSEALTNPSLQTLFYRHLTYIPAVLKHNRRNWVAMVITLAKQNSDIVTDMLDRRYTLPLFSTKVKAYLNGDDIFQLLKAGCKDCTASERQIQLVFSRRFFGLLEPDAKKLTGQQLAELLEASESDALRDYIANDSSYQELVDKYYKELGKESCLEKKAVEYALPSTANIYERLQQAGIGLNVSKTSFNADAIGDVNQSEISYPEISHQVIDITVDLNRSETTMPPVPVAPSIDSDGVGMPGRSYCTEKRMSFGIPPTNGYVQPKHTGAKINSGQSLLAELMAVAVQKTHNRAPITTPPRVRPDELAIFRKGLDQRRLQIDDSPEDNGNERRISMNVTWSP